MSNLGNSLKRKLGPLPVWAWAIIAGVALYWYRNRKGGGLFGGLFGAGTGTTGTTATSATTAQLPPTVLEPGESIYDPNTGALTTTPNGNSASGDTTGSGSSDIAAAIDALTSALEAGGGTVDQGVPGPPGPAGPAGKPGKNAAKPKPAHKTPPKKPSTKAGSKPKSRSTTSTRTGKRVKMSKSAIESLSGFAGGTRRVKATATTGTRLRQRPKTGLLRAAPPIQHPVATHPKVTPKPPVHPAPRPSSPPSRAIRQPPKPAPKKITRRR
jgi:hypothetical protein